MKSKNIDDILNEMRNRADTVIEGRTTTERNFVPQEKIDEWADQIESSVKNMHGLAQAHCNMLAQAVKYHKDKHIGNAAALRKTLVRFLTWAQQDLWENSCESPNHRQLANAIVQEVSAVLAEPPRNCDMGNEEEQAQRIDAFCKSHGTDENGCYRCEECPLLRIDRCELKWSQMPYEGGNDGIK